MALEGLESRRGTLAELFPQFHPETLQEGSEIEIERRTLEDKDKKNDLRNTWHYTANLPVYKRTSETEVLVGIGGRRTFLKIAGEDIGEFCRQLVDPEIQNYYLTPPQIDSLDAELAQDITFVNLANVRLKGDNPEYGYIEIGTADYHATKLNREEKIIVAAARGSMEERKDGDKTYTDFGENMKELQKAGKTTTRVYLLKHGYVKQEVGVGKAIVRASWLGNFGNDSNFGAFDCYVDYPNRALRGVPLVGEADAQKILDTLQILRNPVTQKFAADNLTPETAPGYSNVLTLYVGRHQE